MKALLFDLDGTLVDTAADFVDVLNRQRQLHSLPPLPNQTIRDTVSDGARALTKLAFGGQEGEPAFEERKEELLSLYLECVGNKALLFAGMPEVLIRCIEQDVPWGIVTNKPRIYTDKLLSRIELNNNSLDKLSAVTICPDDVTASKPNPESLHLAANRIETPPHECIYVGDHIRDIQAGKAANMTTVAAKYGYISEPDAITDWNSDHYIDKPIDLISLFLK